MIARWVPRRQPFKSAVSEDILDAPTDSFDTDFEAFTTDVDANPDLCGSEVCPVASCRRHKRGFDFSHECARHALRHYTSPLVCQYCPQQLAQESRTFARADLFHQHLRDDHDPFECHSEAPCPVCAKFRLRSWDLAIHFSACVLLKLVEQQQSSAWDTAGSSVGPDTALDESLPPRRDSGSAALLEEAPSDGKNKDRRKHPAKWLCSLCPKRYTRAAALRAHMDNHSGRRPFECATCGLAFARNHDRKTHEAIHAGARNYACHEPGCGYQSSRATNLKRHALRHRKKEASAEAKPLPENATESQNAAMVLTEMAGEDLDFWDEL